MRKNNGQTLTEFVLVFTVLLIATTGVLAMYKRFWKTKYQRAAAPSRALTGIITQSNYVK
ncbi:hypothetical protein [Candidatus Endomicrobiellum devescovinae]|jgi:hypothetical protein|uniref:hypothetical protein n=1 Tax=Candidatus Endomicrobiellum devescovinae TaxID=3242322 RepID=UPI00282F5F9B|nr:hypothetical protein [Endomicrobium sp.]MDR1244104.1 hypothetical protein [Endomicrobium sp.]MDR1434201.1 hypothetical protein [Endomicrobium sp.]MDR2428097.1 hypothetical protein [Endomicrobium sp.]MDR2818333.1 hypothetical protein [Endomicrobium sp.]